jgi:hypothetical protein
MRKMALVSVFAIVLPLLNHSPEAPADSLAAQQPSPQERVAALKQSLQENQKRLRRYEWIETTTVSLKGEEKSKKQQHCYYGADGKIQKVPIGDPSAEQASEGRGRRGGRMKQKIVENKKEEMQEYMERAVNLIHMYVPPDPALMKSAKDAGTVAARLTEPGHARLEFRDYVKPGDLLAIDVDAAANLLSGLTVASFLDSPKDPVNLSVQFARLEDATSYPAQTTLDAPAKNIRVTLTNSGYKPR